MIPYVLNVVLYYGAHEIWMKRGLQTKIPPTREQLYLFNKDGEELVVSYGEAQIYIDHLSSNITVEVRKDLARFSGAFAMNNPDRRLEILEDILKPYNYFGFKIDEEKLYNFKAYLMGY